MDTGLTSKRKSCNSHNCSLDSLFGMFSGWRTLGGLCRSRLLSTTAVKRYTAEHEWVERLGEGRVRVGITEYAQRALGDLVYVELPPVGTSLQRGDPLGIVESVKGASDVYAPVSGVVCALNAAAIAKPSLINKHPEQEGIWDTRLSAINPLRMAL